MKYVDGFVITIPKKNLKDYLKIARMAGKVWMKYGALEYIEAVGDDLDHKGVIPDFPKMLKLKPGETALFSFIVYKSRKHRDAVNKKVMADPRMKKPPKKMPFDPKKMFYGGFKTIVDL
jgi:uncharacterized protein YbaA (DUF1428 family)